MKTYTVTQIVVVLDTVDVIPHPPAFEYPGLLVTGGSGVVSQLIVVVDMLGALVTVMVEVLLPTPR
jgi:hypothetical protein